MSDIARLDALGSSMPLDSVYVFGSGQPRAELELSKLIAKRAFNVPLYWISAEVTGWYLMI